MPFKHMNDKTCFPSYHLLIRKNITLVESCLEIHTMNLCYIFTSNMTTQVQAKLEEQNELCKFHNLVDLKSSE